MKKIINLFDIIILIGSGFLVLLLFINRLLGTIGLILIGILALFKYDIARLIESMEK